MLFFLVKIYSIHKPKVVCISKSKDHKKYEFGNKVLISKTDSGVIVGALSFRDAYDE
jgi:IS5 family transposase